MLYLDYAATTPPYPEVVEAVREVMVRFYGNPSSIHRIGMEAERLVIQSRETIAGILRVKPAELIFTSCGTESNNLAVKGAALAARNRGNHMITTPIEHASVSESVRQLESLGFRITVVPVDESGAVRLDKLEEALDAETVLVSVMHVNNEMGRIQPIADVARLLKAYPAALLHVDGVQSVGKLPFSPAELGIDLLSASAHKFRGPKGAGFLYCREGVRLEPLLAGGGQEGGSRSGTENVPLIVGMAKALRMATDRLDDAIERKRLFRAVLAEGIASIPELRLTGPTDGEGMAPHIVHLTFPGMKSEVVVHALERHGYFISTKSACSSGEEKPSGTLLAMGFDKPRAVSGLRISYPEDYTEDDARRFVTALRDVVAELRPMIRKSKQAGGSPR
ncbi:cysteine desulfurase [Gordoniibacillus kamchatkensis]|uniref:Cysteine desulfurase n=1 Tax=Gordoniibacillus kamchatkensis TaxID=1590651 RepID=A0ABR5AL70_9BACL|nr:cysteine desulfurase family protein [Paenibacillus sp. VKM B-2647]KIL41720.1 cysteine desulfurase [Paenibacillus sp. VKM B-2647]